MYGPKMTKQQTKDYLTRNCITLSRSCSGGWNAHMTDANYHVLVGCSSKRELLLERIETHVMQHLDRRAFESRLNGN